MRPALANFPSSPLRNRRVATMEATEPKTLHRRRGRFATRMASGIFALIPIIVTFLVLRFVFNASAGILLPIVDAAAGSWPPVARAALALAILLVGIYLLGEIAAHVVGRRVLALVEDIVLRLPFVKVVYSISKQVVSAFQGRGAKAFQSVVFVDFPRPGLKSVAFVTSNFVRPDGSAWSTVFVPTTPNPTTGFLQIVRREELEATQMTVEEGIKMIMSLGVLKPERGRASEESRSIEPSWASEPSRATEESDGPE